MFKKIAVAAALALMASSSFAAAPTAFYGGLDLGSSKIDDVDGNKVSVGGFLGYGVNEYFAVELGYRQLGKWDIGFGDLKVKQTHLSAVGFYPLNPQFDLYGRLGYNDISVKASGAGVSYNDDPSGVVYGVGLNYNFAPNLSGRVEVQKPTSDSTNIGVGIVWQF